MKTVQALLVGTAAILVAAAVPACAADQTGTSTDTLKVAAVAAGPFTQQFNPLLLGSQNGNGYAAEAIFEPLMMDDFATGQVKPWLVASYSWSKDGRSLTLNLRPGITWSDGRPLTADDVAFTFNLIRQNKALNTNSMPLADAKAVSGTQAVITFTRPDYQEMWWRTTVVPKHLWSTVSDPVKYANTKPVGTGPYMLKSFTSQAITLQRNPHYWQPGQPKMETLQYLSFDSDSSMVAALQTGQVDWITPSAADPKVIVSHSSTKLGYWATKPNTGMTFLLPNEASYPTNQQPLRKAMSQALDRSQLSSVALGGHNEAAQSPTGLDVATRGQAIAPQYRSLRYGGADTAGAKATLTAAGYRMGGDGVFVTPRGTPLKLTLTVPSSDPYGDWVRAGQLMAAELRAAGIAVTVKTEAQVTWRSDTALGNFQLTMRSLGGTLSTFDVFNRIFQQSSGNTAGKAAKRNYERYRDAQAGALLEQYARSAQGSPGEAQALAGLEKIMVEQIPVIPLFFNSGVGMWNTDAFTGWPGTSNPYAVPVGNSPNSVMVLSRVGPAK